MTLTEDTPFVVFGDDWGRYPSTMQHVFRHIAVRSPVVWVNGIGHALPKLNARSVRRAWEKLATVARARVVATPSTHRTLGGGVPASIIQPLVLPWHNLGLVHSLNTRSLTRAIIQRLASLDLHRPPVLVTGSPPSVGVVGQLGEIASVYFCMDDFLNFPSYTASMLAPLEARLLDRVDLVVATAESLTRSKFPRSGRAHHLPQGVNYAHFAEPRPEPADLVAIPRPRIGFAGSLSTQCDLHLIARLAKTWLGASVVLVGPVSFDRQALEVLRLPNVHILGVRPYEDLPAYVQHFDVGIVPYLLSAWTVAVDPLKVLEYLAAGLPVVTTAIPEAAKYAGTIAVAADDDAFVDAVGAALAEERRTSRSNGRALARDNTWERRADTLVELIRGVIADREASRSSGTRTRGT